MIRTKKIRIYPDAVSRARLRRYFGLSRYWFNKTIEHLKQSGTVANYINVRKIIRDQVKASQDVSWAFDCPSRTIEDAIIEACEAVKNAKKKSKKTKTFNSVKFRSKKDLKQSFVIAKNAINEQNGTIFKKKNFRVNFKTYQEIPKHVVDGTRIIKEEYRWYLIVPVEVEPVVHENQVHDTVALDPGVRTFITYWSPQLQGKIGHGDIGRIVRLCHHLDDLISRTSKTTGKQKKRMKLAAARMRFRIRCIVDDIHKKTASFLTTHFKRVMIPTFKTSGMVKGLHSSVARNMMTWAHFRFKQFLKAKAEQNCCEVVEVSEAWTSKTCSFCGTVHNIGSKKVLVCSCGTHDRDMNAARGIYLRSVHNIKCWSGNIPTLPSEAFDVLKSSRSMHVHGEIYG